MLRYEVRDFLRRDLETEPECILKQEISRIRSLATLLQHLMPKKGSFLNSLESNCLAI
jgi:hypothetical protein